MGLKTKYRALAISLMAAGLLSACHSAGNGTTGGGNNVTATAIEVKNQSANLFTQETNLTGSLSIESSDSQWYLNKATITIKNTGTTPIDLSKSAISFNSQDSKGVAIDVGTLTNWYVSPHSTSYSLAFSAGNATAQVGKITTGNGSAPIINPGEEITFTGGFNLKGNVYDAKTAQSSFSLDGSAPAPAPDPEPAPGPGPGPAPEPTPVPSDKCNGIAQWDSSKVYTGGQKVQLDGIEYTAKWWTQSNNPATSGTDGPWKKVQECGEQPAPVPAIGELDVIVDTTNTACKTTSACHGLAVHVSDAAGKEVSNFVVPDTALGGVFTQPIKGLQANVAYSVATDSIQDTVLAYDPTTAKATVIKDATVKVSAKYTKIAPAIATGKMTISVPTVLASYTGDMKVEILNTVANAVVATYMVKQGASFTTENLPVSDAEHQYSVKLSQGLADPKAGKYFIENGNPIVTITKDQTATLSLPLIQTTKPLNTVTVNLSGLDGSDLANVTFEDASHTFAYVNDAGAKTGTLTYLVESGLDFAISLNATTSNYEQNKLDFIATINQNTTYTAVFKKKEIPPAPAISYDYKPYFKDYNNKFDIAINGVTNGKVVVFTSNSKLADSLWGSCFGQSVSTDMAKTETASDGYKITLTAPNNGSFDFTKQCTLMYDTKSATVLAGSGTPATNIMVTSMTVDGQNAPIYQACASTGCKDPGNGYVNAGYYAQWAVWGRQYNPNNMPFDSINDIIYAFIGFDPATGNLKTLDGAADSWGLAATTKAVLSHPYMKAHLSFGGWTNNGVNTAPMFQKLSSSPAAMQTFAEQAVALMKKNKFTGLDIDWEWWSDYSNSQAPAKQMLSFYKVLHAELDKASKADGKKYTLAIAVNGGVSRIDAMQDTAGNPNAVANFWSQVNGLVDQINLMTYDYHGAYDQDAAYFHANYDFSNVPTEKQVAVGQPYGWSVKASVAAYQKYGVAAKKLVVGLPIYARTMEVSNSTDGGLLQPIKGAGFGDYENGVLDYKCLINPTSDAVNGCGVNVAPSDIVFYDANATGDKLASFNKYGRDAMQPWGYSPSTKTFVTFDDVWSVRAKTQKVIDGKLGGTMFWELDGDSTNANKSLVKAVANKYSGS